MIKRTNKDGSIGFGFIESVEVEKLGVTEIIEIDKKEIKDLFKEKGYNVK